MDLEYIADPEINAMDRIQAGATNQTSQSHHTPAQPPAPYQAHTSAPKRMANGDVKTALSSYPTSPTDHSLYAHSRNSSAASHSSQIGEVNKSVHKFRTC